MGKIIRRAGNDADFSVVHVVLSLGGLTNVIIFRHLNVLIAKY